MIKYIDGENAEIVGIRYDADESAAVAFALKLYADQLVAGRIVDNPDEKPLVQEAVELSDELQAEIVSGLTTVSPNEHRAVIGIYLHYLVCRHELLPMWMYQAGCKTLGVRPFELFINGMEARRMLNGENTNVEIIPGHSEQY